MGHDFTMLACLLDAVVVSDKQGVIVFVNKTTNALFGYDDGELVGQNVSVLCDPDTAQRHDAFLKRYVMVQNRSVMGTANREVHGRCKDGTVVPVAISLSETAAGEDTLFVATFRDLRGQRETERLMLKAKQDQVEKEAATNASQDMLRYLEHEVRQPLNGIMGMLELVDSDLVSEAELEKEDLKEKIKEARRCADHLLTIITDFVDIRRIEAGLVKLTLGDSTLHQVAKDAVDICANMEENEDVDFAFVAGDGYDPAALYQVDATRVRQVLVNLIGNALKFTKKGKVTLRVSVVREGQRDVVSFEVADTGCGVSPEILRQLFPEAEGEGEGEGEGAGGEDMQVDDGPDVPKSAKSNKTPRQATPFVSGKQDDLRTFQGTGLGLRLSQLLAGVMAGSISCRSEFPAKINPDGSGSGSTFVFEVPLTRVGVVQDHSWSPIVPRRAALQRASSGKKEEAASSPAVAAPVVPSPSPLSMSPMMQKRRVAPSSPLVSEVQRARPASKWASSLAHESRFAPDAGARPAAPASRGRRLNFLVVDDMKINRRVLRTILHTLGHSIDEAENGEEAIEKVENNKFDLIFMDVRMPVLGGREATLRIRSHQNTALRSIPIIAITGDVCAEDVKRSLDAGMNEVLGKPITKESVVRVIEKLYSS